MRSGSTVSRFPLDTDRGPPRPAVRVGGAGGGGGRSASGRGTAGGHAAGPGTTGSVLGDPRQGWCRVELHRSRSTQPLPPARRRPRLPAARLRRAPLGGSLTGVGLLGEPGARSARRTSGPGLHRAPVGDGDSGGDVVSPCWPARCGPSGTTTSLACTEPPRTDNGGGSGVSGRAVLGPAGWRLLVAQHSAQFIGHGVLGGFVLRGLLPSELNQLPDRGVPSAALGIGRGGRSGHEGSFSHHQQPTQPR